MSDSKAQQTLLEDSSSGSESSGKRFRLTTIIKLFFSFGLIGIVLYFSDLEEFIQAAKNVSFIYLLAFALLIYLDRALVVYKWNLLLKVRGAHVSFVHLYLLYSTALLAGVVLPSTVGGDMFRVYDLSKHNVSARVSVASIIVERILGFMCILVIAAIGIGVAIYLISDIDGQIVSIVWTLAFGILICASFVFVIRNNAFNIQLEKLSQRFRDRKVVVFLYDIYQHCRDYRDHTKVLAKVIAYTLLRQTVPIFMNIILVYAFGLGASFLELFAIIPLIVLGVRLPISIGGIGVQEGLYVVLFGLVGVSVSQALLLSLTYRVMCILCMLPFGVLYFISGRSIEATDSKSKI